VASDDLDLSTGDPNRGDSASERRQRRRASRTKTASDTNRETGTEFTDSEVRRQLARAFDGLARGREAKPDPELAAAIREESDAMTEGFVTLTENVKPLRLPLMIVLNLLITLQAFGRVGGILWGRFVAWRNARAVAREDVTFEGDHGVPITNE